MSKSLPVYEGGGSYLVAPYFLSHLLQICKVMMWYLNSMLTSFLRTDDIVKRLLSLELASHVCDSK